MSENNKLEKRSTEIIKEKSQYVIAFGVIASMLYITGFPIFVIFFFGILAYFIWKTLSAPSQSGTREIFEFYLISNEILRDDERRWYGFEIQDAIVRGEHILKYMSGAPPLIYFTLGALYNKIGDHQAAVKNLSHVIENEGSEETKFIYPSPELRNYVQTLRKIEREPAEAPLMSAAVRALERARRNRGKSLLENSRAALDAEKIQKAEAELEKNRHKQLAEKSASNSFFDTVPQTLQEEFNAQYESADAETGGQPKKRERRKKDKSQEELFANRQTISEVLRDIYDSKP